MLLNESPLPIRAPRLRLFVNGEPSFGVATAGILTNNHFAADRFQASLTLGTDPVFDAAFWATSPDVLVDIQVSLDGKAFLSLIQGTVDRVAMDPVAGTIRLEGRDLTAALIETRTQEAFSNRTASEIATILAERHNLTPVVTATTTPVGRYYQDEHDRITLDQFSHATTEWDLLVFLARQEGFDVYVQGTTLYFAPRPQSDTGACLIQPSDVIALRLERALTLARDIEVTVKSWNSRQKAAFTQTATAHRQTGTSRSTGLSSSPQRYVFVKPNLTPDQALRFAQQTLAELSQHERVIEITMPGELLLTSRSQIMLSGTGTDFDQLYYVDVIERELSVGHGFVQRLRAKNTSPRSQSTTPAATVASITG